MAYYYVDKTNGNNSHTGERIPAGDYNSVSYYSPDSVSGSPPNIVVDATLSTLTGHADNFITGGYFYNVTRSAGRVITNYVDSTSTITLATGITSMVNTDSYYILNSYADISQFTSAGGTRSSGDKCYVRANQTHTLAAVLNFDEDGTTDYIYLIGCTSTIDPYHDSSDVLVIIDGNGAAYYVNLTSDDGWYLKNLDIRNTSSVDYACLNLSNVNNVYVEGCTLRDASAATAYNVAMSGSNNIILKTCSVKNSNTTNIYCYSSSNVIVDGCDVRGGALGSTYGFHAVRSSRGILIKDTVFGTTDTHSGGDIYSTSQSTVMTRNVTCSSTNKFMCDTTTCYSVAIHCQDYLNVLGDHALFSSRGTTLRKTDVIRSGGGASSAQMIPASTVTVMNQMTLSDSLANPIFNVWCPASVTTVTVYVRGLNWASFPTAAQLYLEAEYLSDDSPITYSKVVSDELLSDNTTWIGFQCTFTPVVASFATLEVKLGLYEDSTTGIYVDVLPVVS